MVHVFVFSMHSFPCCVTRFQEGVVLTLAWDQDRKAMVLPGSEGNSFPKHPQLVAVFLTWAKLTALVSFSLVFLHPDQLQGNFR